MERRIVAQLFDSIDGVSALGSALLSKPQDPSGESQAAAEDEEQEGEKKKGLVVLIVATNK